MTTLQWALLLLGVGIALALILSNRRERRQLERSVTNALKARGGVGHDWNPVVSAPAAGAGAAFDEYGVSKPRKRNAPEVGNVTRGEHPAAPPAVAEKPAAVPDKLVALYIAEHEGTNILGPKIHAALKAQGLRFGARKIYHRFDGEQPVFSVASLVKPGTLDPDEAADFSTPGLSVFMQLPGPARPAAVLQDMLDTARALARALNAELFDTESRAALTAERERDLLAQVQEWTRRHKTV